MTTAERTATAPALAPLAMDLPAVEQAPILPRGFAAGGATCGIKASGRPDLAIVATTSGPATAAAVFTSNAFAAAPVKLSQRHLGPGHFGVARGVISTSGSANAATGAPGDGDQAAVAIALASALSIPVEQTLHLSTGIIGTRLPVDRVISGIEQLVPRLEESPGGWLAAAEALRTTDSRAKLATTTVRLATGDPITVSGIAKGVGMIHPRMATMLAIMLTDATVEAATLHALLRGATVRTWNQLSVDGDTSTNDTVFLLASGAAGGAPVTADSAAATTLGKAVEAVARDLARQQAADGEGASTLLTCQVSGGVDDADARAVARSVVSSSLVKAATHGRDPNWGRIAGAAGNARVADAPILVAAGLTPADAEQRAGRPAALDPDRLRIAIAGHLVFDGSVGGPVPFDSSAARAAMDASEVLVRLDLGLGDGTGEAFGCDLTEAYVVENSEYTT